jgi:hypothetical protein
MDAALIGTIVGLCAVFGLGAFAQIKAIYHFIKWWAAVTPKQRWGLSLLGPLALLWKRGLPEESLRHRALFVKWEGVFIAVFAAVAIGDFVIKQQPNNFIPTNTTSTHGSR